MAWHRNKQAGRVVSHPHRRRDDERESKVAMILRGTVLVALGRASGSRYFQAEK
jgi:hypothetical protein